MFLETRITAAGDKPAIVIDVSRIAALLGLSLLCGCGRGFVLFLDPVPCEDDPGACESRVTVQRGADILFVIDNSGSMGREQGVLAENFSAFIDVLEAEDVGASYRIGVTDTEGYGFLDATSCRQRLGDFSFQWQPHPEDLPIVLDEQFAGCLAACEQEEIEIVPTATDDDPVLRARPWLEKTDGKANLPAGISMADAFECIGPQGINGNGLEAPLESLLAVAGETGRDSGFLRDNALLAVIVVTDEADCSMSPSAADRIEFAEALYSDPEGPSSGVCWNAGVECSGGPGIYDECHAVDRDFDGQLTTPGNGVLYPVSRYVDGLRDLSAGKLSRGGNGQVLVAVLAGVPNDYPETGRVVYQDSDDPEFNREYGIGPGCGRGTEEIGDPPGIPPVRLLEFADAFRPSDDRNVFSICEQNYAVALEQIAAAIADLGGRACVPGCVADGNPAARGFQPDCEIVEQIGPNGGGSEDAGGDVPPCRELDDGSWEFPTPDVDLCFRALADTHGQTASRSDDISEQCLGRGSNLELVVERRDDVAVPPGSAIRVQCVLAQPEGTNCDGEPADAETDGSEG
jgi:hypothetical protein